MPPDALPPPKPAAVVASAPEREDNDDRKYWRSDNPDIFLPNQPATSIYANPHGQCVIRQQDQYDDEDDFVFISRDHVPALIARLQRFLKEEAE
jgi:hypothetical protein